MAGGQKIIVTSLKSKFLQEKNEAEHTKKLLSLLFATLLLTKLEPWFDLTYFGSANAHEYKNEESLLSSKT